METDEIIAKRLDHHGLVVGIIDELGLIEAIDARFPEYGHEKITIGQAVAGMIVNGLGFSDRPLYLTPQFFEQLPMERLFGNGCEPEGFNRHKLGRSLDALYSAGLTDLFADISSQVVTKEGISTSNLCLDSTSFSLEGEYKEVEQVESSDSDHNDDTLGVRVTHGYSKDHRPDLKQIVAELIVSHDSGVPLAFKCHNDNSSDSTIFQERCQQLVAQFQEGQTLIADSKLYSEENAENLAKIRFVTRIPETNKIAKTLISSTVSNQMQWKRIEGETEEQDGVHYIDHRIDHYNMKQRWVVAYSDQSVKRARFTLNKRAEKEKKKVEKDLFHLQAQRFSCESDARKALSIIEKKLKLHKFSEPIVTECPRFKGKGRPTKSQMPENIDVQINCSIANVVDLDTLAWEKACFIVGSNHLDMSAEEQVRAYKSQAQVELGFRFLKDPLFFASSFYLKKTSRIEALAMVMTLSLLVYSIAQRRLRNALAATSDTIPSQSRCQTSRPTMRWVFQMFWGINEIHHQTNTGRRIFIQGTKEVHDKVIKHLGYRVVELYSKF